MIVLTSITSVAPDVAGQGRAIDVVVNDTPVKGTYDHVLVIAGELVIVEDKNKRAWLHPSTHEVWQLLRRCLDTSDPLVPIVVARKMSPALLVFFGTIGGLAFQTNNQLFHADLRPDLELVVTKRGPNFFDIRFDTSEVEGRLTKYVAHAPR